jgi:hypothetical protein
MRNDKSPNQGMTQKDFMWPGMSFVNWADWLEEFAAKE